MYFGYKAISSLKIKQNFISSKIISKNKPQNEKMKINKAEIKKEANKIKTKLPLSIVLNYSLNDIFIIKGQKYRINSITTNLSTGMANLELLLAL